MPCSTPAVRLPLVVLVSLCQFGCSRRPGLNFDCQWVPDTAFAADLGEEAHIVHLLDDIRAAEELDIRHRDRLSGYRLVDSFGIVSRHGRDSSQSGRGVDRQVQHECLATLIQRIASTHGVTRSDVDAMRPQLARRGLDLPVTIPVVGLFGLVLMRHLRWARHRFASDEWLAWLAVSVAASLLIPAAVLALGWLWAMLVEVVRVGNEHVGYRARTDSLRANFLVMFGLGVVATWVSSAMSARRHTTDVSAR